MIKVHHLIVSQSDKVLWLMEELGAPYELISYSRMETRQAPPELKALHPLGQVPLIQDGDITIAESGAVFAYILEKHDPEHSLSIPMGEPGHVDYLYWYHYASSGLFPATMQRLMSNMLDNQWLKERAEASYALHLGQMDAHLADRKWLAGDKFTAADMLALFPFAGLRAFGEVDLSDRPNILAWLERISARPAYQVAMKKGGWEKDMAAR